MALLDQTVVVYRNFSDASLFVIGVVDENELLLASVLETIVESLSLLLRNNVNHRTLLENFDYLLLVLDEVVDRGVVMETDPAQVARRVAMMEGDSATPLHEKTLSELIDTARDQLTDRIKKTTEELRRAGY